MVEAIIILPRNLFYTTDISVTLWVLNKNKKARVVEQNGKLKRYRNREDEILFMDLRQMGSPYEKKYIELTNSIYLLGTRVNPFSFTSSKEAE